MIQKLALGIAVIFGSLSTLAMAQDLTGTWQQIDDKTGSPKAVIEIRKEANQTYTGKIIKVTPRPGYTHVNSVINALRPIRTNLF